MEQQYLYEFKCDDNDCGKYFLAMSDTEDGVYCPYCGDYAADYAPGEIFPVMEYTPKMRKVVTDF